MWNDILLIAVCIAVLAAVLYLRRAAIGRPVKPYRGDLVPPDFYKVCPPIPAGQRPTVLWFSPMPPHAITVALVKHLTGRLGWEVFYVAPAADALTETPVIPYYRRGALQTVLLRTHVIVAEGDSVPVATKVAAATKKPLKVISHGQGVADIYTAAHLVPEGAAALVVHKPFYAVNFATHTTRRYITAIGLTTASAKHFYALAKAMPDRDFLVVKPAPQGKTLPNVTVWPAQDDPRNAYAHTAVLVVPPPSVSWVPAVLEAAASGIPTVAPADDKATKEALGDLGVYADSDQTADWVIAIQGLQGPAYESLTRRLIAHAARWDPSRELATFAQSLVNE